MIRAVVLNRGIGNDDNGGDPALHREKPVNDTLDLPAGRTLFDLPFTMADLARLRFLVTRRSEDAGLSEPRLSDFVLAVHEVASNAVVHGGGKGRIQLTYTGDGLRCVVTDSGPGLTRPKPCESATLPEGDDAEDGRGLWLAQALTDHFEVAVRETGTAVTLVTLLS